MEPQGLLDECEQLPRIARLGGGDRRLELVGVVEQHVHRVDHPHLGVVDHPHQQTGQVVAHAVVAQAGGGIALGGEQPAEDVVLGRRSPLAVGPEPGDRALDVGPQRLARLGAGRGHGRILIEVEEQLDEHGAGSNCPSVPGSGPGTPKYSPAKLPPGSAQGEAFHDVELPRRAGFVGHSQHFGGDNACPGVPVDRVLELGAEDYEGGDPSVFNMAVMGFRLAQRANGVSELHGHVAREMFARLWPGFDEPEVPIGHITNGVHAPTWVAPEVFELARREIGEGLVQHPTDSSRWEAIQQVADADIWAVRRLLRGRLVTDARRRVKRSWEQRGASEAELGWVDQVLDPDVLTIGFARRVPSYKRLTLMLRDPERLTALLLDPVRPVQLVIAGKAHPADDGGRSSSRSSCASPTRPTCATASSSCPTTTSRWRRRSTRDATSG